MAGNEERLKVLDTFEFNDKTANIEGTSFAISIDTIADYNFKDSKGFDGGIWNDELNQIAKMEDLIAEGEKFVGKIYCYRSCSVAIAQSTLKKVADKEVYMKVAEVIQPEIEKLVDFMEYKNVAIEKFISAVVYIAEFEKDNNFHISDGFLKVFIRFLDLLTLLDSLKNMKASLNNDFSYYKRTLGLAKISNHIIEKNELGLFLASRNVITNELKAGLEKACNEKYCERYIETLTYCAMQAADWIESENYVTPTEKYRLLRSIPSFLFLSDNPDSKYSLHRLKSVKVERLVRIFKRNPIVPLYGDMQTNITHILERSSIYSDDSWGIKNISESKMALEYEVVHHMGTIRRSYNMYLSRFNNLMREVKVSIEENKDSSIGTIPRSLSSELSKIIIEGYKLLCNWACRILSQASWKYAHTSNKCPEETLQYEKAVRYNYSDDEKIALVELIAMLKSLSAVMLKEDALIAPILRTFIYTEVQEIVQADMRDLLRYLYKNKEKYKCVLGYIVQMRALVADWKDSVEPNDHIQASSSKKLGPVEIPKKIATLSPTQLELFTSLIYGVIKYRRKKGLFGDKDLSESQLKALCIFYNQLQIYPYLLAYSKTIREITDLGDLWYREFHLDLAKKLQFEIDTSLAWCLVDHILESSDATMMDSVLYPLDIYNDAAQRALHSLKQQFLYSEIESEVSLAFEQLIYKLGEKSFMHYKYKAAVTLLDKGLRTQLEGAFPDRIQKLYTPKSRLELLYRQRHVQLLGRTIDLNECISQASNKNIRANLKYAIARYEASPITAITELELLLENIHLTHTLMIDDGLSLDPWEELLNEANDSTSINSFQGRIILHSLFEIVSDLTPNYTYNSITDRFIGAPSLNREEEEVPREPMPKMNPKFLYGGRILCTVFAQISELYSSFFGLPHLVSLIRVIGKESLFLLVSEILVNMSLKLKNVLDLYLVEVIRGMPQDKTNLPKYSYGIQGLFDLFKAKTSDIANYPPLITEVFQNFREWGNCIAFFSMLDTALSHIDTITYLQAAPALGIFPPLKKKKSKDASIEQYKFGSPTPLSKIISGIQSQLIKNPNISVSSPETVSGVMECAKMAEVINGFKINERHSFLFMVMQEIDKMLMKYRHKWGVGAGNVDNELIPIENTFEFYRVWSAMLFVFIQDIEINELFNKTTLQLMGDGFLWAGSAIIYFLGQRHRFESMDFSYYLLRVAEHTYYDGLTSSLASIFLHRLPEIKEINDNIFKLLETVYPIKSKPFTDYIPPPTSDSDIAAKFVAVELN